MVNKAALEAFPLLPDAEEGQHLGSELGETELAPAIHRLELLTDELAAETGIETATWSSFRQTVKPLGDHSPMHYAHSLRVASYACARARLEYSDRADYIQLALSAGLGHDVGKLKLDKALLE